MIVERWGLHFAPGDVGFLLQPGTSQSLYTGVDCPFQVRLKRGQWRSCPHAVDLAAAHDGLRSVLEDPLARWFLDPTPVGVIDQTDGIFEVLAALAMAYTPIRSFITPAWMVSRKIWVEEAGVTNLAPWVLTDFTSKQVSLISSMAGLPRPVLIVRSAPVPVRGAELTTDLRASDLPQLDMAALGAWAIRKRLQKATL